MENMDWKLYNAEGQRKAAFVHAEDAAAMVAIQGKNATIRIGRNIVWTEGKEQFEASESYDRAAVIMIGRYNDWLNI